MSSIGVVFPGQGSQRKGMSRDFRIEFSEARAIFEEASRALSLDVEKICDDENDTRLDLTEFTQPCILTAEIAMFQSLKAHFGLEPEYFGGHSLGEYTALVAAGVIPFDAAVQIVRTRGRLMQESVKPGVGAMAAVIFEGPDGVPRDEVRPFVEEFGVDIANDNSLNQLVISGDRVGVETICAELPNRFSGRAVRVVPLAVSAPFHSRHMANIEGDFRKVLEAHQESFVPARATRVVSNWTGGFHTGRLEDLIEALTRQISGQVRWRDNMEVLRNNSSAIFEMGPNRPLSGFFRTVGVSVQAIIDYRTARRAFAKPEPLTNAASTAISGSTVTLS